MKKILLLVEGQTEERFIVELLNPYLQKFGRCATPIIIKTKYIPNGKDFKGGSVKYEEFKKQLKKLLNDTSSYIVTTMIDYYRFPFPEKNEIKGKTPIEKVKYVEDKIKEEVNHSKFLPYLSLHEFESLLFSKPEEIIKVLWLSSIPYSKKKLLKIFQKVCEEFSNNPEEINDNPNTCPSGRIIKQFPHYQKILHSILICKNIGIEQIKKSCRHFSEWLDKLTA